MNAKEIRLYNSVVIILIKFLRPSGCLSLFCFSGAELSNETLCSNSVQEDVILDTTSLHYQVSELNSELSQSYNGFHDYSVIYIVCVLHCTVQVTENFAFEDHYIGRASHGKRQQPKIPIICWNQIEEVMTSH